MHIHYRPSSSEESMVRPVNRPHPWHGSEVVRPIVSLLFPPFLENNFILVDVVPKTVTYGEYKKNRAATEAQKAKGKAAAAAEADADVARTAADRGDGPFGNRYADIRAMFAKNDDEKTEDEKPNGHPPLNGQARVDGPVGMDLDDDEATEDEEPDAAAMQIEMEMRGGRRASTANGSSPAQQRRSSGFTAINNGK